jgi:beta-phosphoglucomutase-like phosphatase (HAD superfamily)
MASAVTAVIFDLDGTVLDTETLVLEVAKGVVESHGASLTLDAQVWRSQQAPSLCVATSLRINRT